MVSHSSSASLSSLSFSRTSQYTSTSSSQSSSPDSAVHNSNSTFVALNHSGSATAGLRTSESLYNSSIVAFSWEEKPGVLKKKHKIMHTASSCEAAEHTTIPPLSCDDGELVDIARAGADANLLRRQPPSKHARIFTSQRPKTSRVGQLDLPRIRPPPCLYYSHAELHASMEQHHGDNKHQHPHVDRTSAAAVGSKIMASLSLHKIRRHHRSSPSLEDDPFWLAMVACTNDADKGVHMHCRSGLRKGRDPTAREINRNDSWLARRVQESIHFDQCMPRHTLENHTISRKAHSSRAGQEKANEHTSSIDDEEALASCKPNSLRKVHHTHTDAHHHEDEADSADAMSMSMHSARLANKAFKALSMARSDLHDRCKALLHQPSPPVVDISCGSHRSSKSTHHRGVAPKHKLPDLFGCKSNHPRILSSRFS